MMRPLAAAAVLFAAAAAVAAEVGDEAGLRLPLDAGACVIHPAKLRDPAACKGADVAALTARAAEVDRATQMAGGTMRHVALVTWPATGVRLQVIARPAGPPPSAAALTELVAGLLAATGVEPATRRDDPRLRYDQVTVGGAAAIRYAVDAGPTRKLLYIVAFGAAATYQLTFEASTAGRARSAADSVTSRLRLR